MKNIPNPISKAALFTISLFCNFVFSQAINDLASNEVKNVIVLEPSFSGAISNEDFEKKYHYLVARSYFKLLAEAHKSERKLKKELERYSLVNEKLDTKENQTLRIAHRKYRAHRAMVSGLNSWNLFSEDRTGDMLYFMAENEGVIYKMYSENLNENEMVKYLIYKLADLYHLHEEN